MKQLLPFLLALSLAGSAHAKHTPSLHAIVRPTETVYVCMSKTSYAYHSSDTCKGLNRCSHEVKQMSAAEAEKLGKRACQKCH